VVNYNGTDLLDMSAFFDDKGNLVNLLSGGKKYNTTCSGVPTGTTWTPPVGSTRLYVEKAQLGGGGINMERAFSQHSKGLQKVYTSLHVEDGSHFSPVPLEKILADRSREGTPSAHTKALVAMSQYVDAHMLEIELHKLGVEDRLIYVNLKAGGEVKNLVISEVTDASGKTLISDKIIARGTKFGAYSIVYDNTNTSTNVGTFVINSATSNDIFNKGIQKYNACTEPKLGILCLTEKMAKLYSLAQNQAISQGFITIFNETEALKYANPSRVTGNDKWGIYITDIIDAMKYVISQQGEKRSRIYITLGPYGCIGIDDDGSMYRTSTFPFKGSDLNTNGAGDTFASMVARLEHERKHKSNSDYSMLEIMAVASGTAAFFIENQNKGWTVTENNVKHYLKDQILQYESLGNIDTFALTNLGKLSNLSISRTGFKDLVMK
jgi:hypothetical protein